jgi:hypothetical protein
MPTVDQIVSDLSGPATSHLGANQVLRAVRTAVAKTLPKLEDDRPRTYTVPTLRSATREGEILRGPDDERAIRIDWSNWRLEPAGAYGDDAMATVVDDVTVAQRGPWRREASAPPHKLYREVVYLDLDGTGRKVYAADAATYEIKRYEKEAKTWEKAGKPEGKAPSQPSVFNVVIKGVEYTLTPSRWYGVSNAVEWQLLNSPRPSRRSEAAKTADRRKLSPDVAKALDAVILDLLPTSSASYGSYTLRDVYEEVANNRSTFRRLLQGNVGGTWWSVAVEPQDQDQELLEKAEYSKDTGERLVGASIRRLIAGGWVREQYSTREKTGYVQTEKVIHAPSVPTGVESLSYKADRSFNGYTDARRELWAAEARVRDAKKAADYPFATQTDADELRAAVEALKTVATKILEGK